MKKKSIAKNYIYNLIYQLLLVVTPLITAPYVSRVLGAEAIGTYGYTYSIVTYFVLFGSLGAAMYGQREIAYVQNDKKKQSKVFLEIVIIRAITLTISMVTYYMTFCLRGENTLYYKILLIEMFSTMFDITWYFQGLEEFKKTVLRNLVIKTISIISIFIFVKSPEHLTIYIAIYTISNLLGNLSLWFYMPKYIEKVEKIELKKHIKAMIVLFVPQIATQIYVVLDKTMIGAILGDMKQVGYYEQAQKIIKTLLLVVTAFGTVMTSRISNIYANEAKEKINDYIKLSFKFVWLIGLPIMFGTMAVASSVVPWFYGTGYDEVVPLMITISPILIFIGLSNVTGMQYLIPTGRNEAYTISVTVGAISNLILNIILIRLFKASGAAIASVISEFLVLVVQVHFLKKEMKVKEITENSWKYWISSITMGIIVYLISTKLTATILNTMILVAIGIIIYGTMLIILKDEFIMNNIKNIKEIINNKKKEGQCNE